MTHEEMKAAAKRIVRFVAGAWWFASRWHPVSITFRRHVCSGAWQCYGMQYTRPLRLAGPREKTTNDRD